MQQQQQHSCERVFSADLAATVDTPAGSAVQTQRLEVQPTVNYPAPQTATHTQMPAYPHDCLQARPQQLGWDSQHGAYMSLNVTVNLPAQAIYQQQVPAQPHQQVQAMMHPQQQQPAALQSHQLLQQKWSSGSLVPQLHPQPAAQHMQLQMSQPGYSLMHAAGHRHEQLPLWQPPPVAPRAMAASTGQPATSLGPAPYAHLQQTLAGAALTQHVAAAGPAPAMQPLQLHTPLLQVAPQQQLHLQEVPAYALLLMPPAGAESQQHQLLPAQAAALPPKDLEQQVQQLTDPFQQQQQPRKTRRGPNRGRSKQKKAQKEAAAVAAAAAADKEAATAATGADLQLQASIEQPSTAARSGRVTSGSSSSYISATTSSATSGSELSGNQGGADAAAEAQATAGTPHKKHVRHRGRRGKKSSSKDLSGTGESQGEHQALSAPTTAAAGSTGGSKTSGSSKQPGQALVSSPSTAAAASELSAAQPVKRTTGLSHRQRYRRKQWELQRALEQQRAEADAKQQAEAHVHPSAEGQLVTSQQLPVMWPELQRAALSSCVCAQQLQSSPMLSAHCSPGLPVVSSVPQLAVLQAELQQRMQVHAATVAAGNSSSPGASVAAETGKTGAGAGAAGGTQSRWGPEVPFEGHGGDGAGHVDQNLDEWLSKLLEL